MYHRDTVFDPEHFGIEFLDTARNPEFIEGLEALSSSKGSKP
jgi:hypothetical protein